MRSAPTKVSDTVSDTPEIYLAGEIIDKKYRLVRTLGKGGMGTLWVAHNLVLDVHVALKLIRLKDTSSAKQLGERLLQEARAAAKLSHPAIVRVFDFGKTRRGDPFVIMELLHGETLAHTLERELRMAGIRAVQTVLPIVDALMTAHAKGIVHRDVKPENIILARAEDGRVQPKLLDFGIASFIERDKRLTSDGVVVGTPAYMSPEQACGKAEIGPQSDIWSISVLLYELIAGRLPFDCDNYNALLHSIINEDPAPLHTLGAGDEALWCILERGLRKNAEERWADSRTLGTALAQWLDDHGTHEDICATNLRTTWLDVATGTDAPESVRGDGPADTGERRRAGASILRTEFDGHERRTPTGDVPAAVHTRAGRPEQARRTVLLGTVVGSIAIGLGAVVLWKSSNAPLDTAPEAASVQESRRPATSLVEKPVPSAPAAASSSEAARARMLRPVSVESLPTDTRKGARPGVLAGSASPPANSPPNVAPAAAKHPAPPDKKFDFGF